MGCTQTSRFDHFSSLSASWGLCIHTAFFYLVVAFYSLPEDMAIPFPKSHSFLHHHVMHHKYVCLCLFFSLLLIGSLIFFFTSFFSHIWKYMRNISQGTMYVLLHMDVVGILSSGQTWPAKSTCRSLFCSDLMLLLILLNYLICLFKS